jgi:hypothetical protein
MLSLRECGFIDMGTFSYALSIAPFGLKSMCMGLLGFKIRKPDAVGFILPLPTHCRAVHSIADFVFSHDGMQRICQKSNLHVSGCFSLTVHTPHSHVIARLDAATDAWASREVCTFLWCVNMCVVLCCVVC